MIEQRHTPFVYIDANPFIYAVEGVDELARPPNDLFSLLRQKPGLGVTSELTLAEVLVKARDPSSRRSFYDLIVWSGIFDLQPVTREILVETADYRRAATNLLPDGQTTMPKLPDAIHVVTAIRSGCRRVVSADGRLRLPAGMTLVEPNDIGLTTLMREIS